MGNSSRRPANMSNINTYLENVEYMEKFRVGPTSSNPGPMLLRVAAMAVKLVVKSKLSILINNSEIKYTIKYTAINTLVDRITS